MDLPWRRVIGLVLGAVLVAVGIALLLRPFASVNWLLILLVLGLFGVAVAEAIAAFLRRDGTPRWLRMTIAGVAFVLGLLIAVLPGMTVHLLVVLAGLLPIAAGIRDLLLAVAKESGGERVVRVLFGLAGLVVGVTILAWPDVTVWVLGVLFGVWLAALGVRLAVTPLVERSEERSARPARRRHLVLRGLLAGLAVVAAVAVAAVGVRLSATPQPDDFYSAPGEVPSEPGVLLRAEPFTRSVPDGAHAWRILYTTRGLGETPAIASGLVVVPDAPGPHPVIGWTHGTTGVATGCAPSLLPEPFVSGAMPDLHEALGNGWAVVATDYIGLGTPTTHEYVVGEPAGHAELDALRAARSLDGADLASETVIWGHSQGGHAALWTAGLAADYAPELDLKGVVAMAPAANLPALLSSFADQSLSLLFGAFVLTGYDAAYPDVRVEDYAKPSGRLPLEAVASRCLTDPGTIVSVLQAGLSGGPIWSRDPSTGALGQRAAENVPTLPIHEPLLIAQGLADPLIVPAAQQDYVTSRCEAGQALEYRTYPGLDHMGVVSEGSPLLGELLEWTRARFAGEPAGDDCE